MSWREDDSEAWRGDTAPATVAPGRDPVAFAPYPVIEALRALGVLKSGERANILHKHGCAFPTDPRALCTCPGGPEIAWADWDEAQPFRALADIPERFIS